MCQLQLISVDFYISLVSISLAFITIPQNIGKIKLTTTCPPTLPRVSGGLPAVGGQWFANKAALFKMVTNIETWYRLETESSNSDFSTSPGENHPIGTGERACKMKTKDHKDLNLPGFSCHNVLLTKINDSDRFSQGVFF